MPGQDIRQHDVWDIQVSLDVWTSLVASLSCWRDTPDGRFANYWTDPDPGPRPTSIVSGILIHPAVWPQRTWTENWGLCPFWWGGWAVRINLTSALSSICAMCPSMKRRREWITIYCCKVRLLGLVILLTSSLQTNWCHLIHGKYSRAPLIKNINPACIHLGDCLAFRSV